MNKEISFVGSSWLFVIFVFQSRARKSGAHSARFCHLERGRLTPESKGPPKQGMAMIEGRLLSSLLRVLRRDAALGSVGPGLLGRRTSQRRAISLVVQW